MVKISEIVSCVSLSTLTSIFIAWQKSSNLAQLQEAAIQRYIEEHKARMKKDEEKWIAEAELEIKQTEDFWNGLSAPDPAAERFDKPDAISLSVKQSTWECDDWLKV